MIHPDGSRTIVVSETEAGDRLDRFVATKLAVSRTRVKKGIEASRILVNGKRATAHYRVRKADRVTVLPFSHGDVPPVAIPEEIGLDVVYEDESIIVVDKSPGMVVHPAPGHYSGTLFNAILNRLWPEIESGRARPGIVHRLDKDTSGLILVAKDDDVKDQLSRDLRERRINRIYRALVWGHMKTLEGKIDAPIGRHPEDRKKMSIYARRKRNAVTCYKVLESFDVCDHVEVRLLTGRTHQIRVHFSSTGHPLVGDATYGGGKGKEKSFMGDARKRAHVILGMISRQALHAFRLEFIHPVTGERLAFTSRVPRDFREVLNYLRGEIGNEEDRE